MVLLGGPSQCDATLRDHGLTLQRRRAHQRDSPNRTFDGNHYVPRADQRRFLGADFR